MAVTRCLVQEQARQKSELAVEQMHTHAKKSPQYSSQTRVDVPRRVTRRSNSGSSRESADSSGKENADSQQCLRTSNRKRTRISSEDLSEFLHSASPDSCLPLLKRTKRNSLDDHSNACTTIPATMDSAISVLRHCSVSIRTLASPVKVGTSPAKVGTSPVKKFAIDSPRQLEKSHKTESVMLAFDSPSKHKLTELRSPRGDVIADFESPAQSVILNHSNCDNLPHVMQGDAKPHVSNKANLKKPLVISVAPKSLDQRAIYHGRNSMPANGPHSEMDVDYTWLDDLSQRQIDDFLDLNDGEKEFFKMWNNFQFHRPAIGISLIEDNLVHFVHTCSDAIVRYNLYGNFVLHLANLVHFGMISRTTMVRTLSLFHHRVHSSDDLALAHQIGEVINERQADDSVLLPANILAADVVAIHRRGPRSKVSTSASPSDRLASHRPHNSRSRRSLPDPEDRHLRLRRHYVSTADLPRRKSNQLPPSSPSSNSSSKSTAPTLRSSDRSRPTTRLSTGLR